MSTIFSFFTSGVWAHLWIWTLVIGIFIGWNIPEPSWAQSLWTKLVTKFPWLSNIINVTVATTTTAATDVTTAVDDIKSQ
jgi:type II secretory pathway component PulF